MAQLAIKGHTTRGREVIELLEMLGGKNINNLKGENQHLVYIIKNSYGKDIHCSWEIPCGYMVFTLEKFLEKFPYKVGDKVQHKGATSCGSVFEVEKMRWVDNHVEYTIKRLWYNNCHTTVKAEHLQPYKEETMEEITDKTNKIIFEANAQCCDIRNDIIKKDMKQVKIDIPKGYEFFGIDDDNKIVLTEKQPQYPKTYRECSLINGCEDRIPLKIIEEFIKLINARNAYWKIAGKQLGLDKPWEPTTETVYCISRSDNVIKSSYRGGKSNILEFPTEEMRNTFYENFKDLIEQCKELL